MKRILVTGATGTVGRQVVSQLLAADARVRALSRNPDAAGLPPGVEVVRGDLTVPADLDGCLDGVDTVFLAWTAPAALGQPALVTSTVEEITGKPARMFRDWAADHAEEFRA